MSGSSSASSDDEQDPSQDGVQKTQRKKSSTKRSLDLQRKISLSKVREEKKESRLHNQQNAVENHNSNNNNNSPGITDSSSATSINIEKSPHIPIKHGKNRQAKNGKISGGYEQFSMSLLTVPMPKDYGEPSSDDLSSEWDSDTVNEVNKTNGTANKESKVRQCYF